MIQSAQSDLKKIAPIEAHADESRRQEIEDIRDTVQSMLDDFLTEHAASVKMRLMKLLKVPKSV